MTTEAAALGILRKLFDQSGGLTWQLQGERKWLTLDGITIDLNDNEARVVTHVAGFELKNQRPPVEPTEPTVPWVMVGRLLCWASQPHDPKGDNETTFRSWVTTDRDRNGVHVSRTFDDWDDLWSYASLNRLEVVLPGQRMKPVE